MFLLINLSFAIMEYCNEVECIITGTNMKSDIPISKDSFLRLYEGSKCGNNSNYYSAQYFKCNSLPKEIFNKEECYHLQIIDEGCEGVTPIPFPPFINDSFIMEIAFFLDELSPFTMDIYITSPSTYLEASFPVDEFHLHCEYEVEKYDIIGSGETDLLELNAKFYSPNTTYVIHIGKLEFDGWSWGFVLWALIGNTLLLVLICILNYHSSLKKRKFTKAILFDHGVIAETYSKKKIIDEFLVRTLNPTILFSIVPTIEGLGEDSEDLNFNSKENIF